MTLIDTSAWIEFLRKQLIECFKLAGMWNHVPEDLDGGTSRIR